MGRVISCYDSLWFFLAWLPLFWRVEGFDMIDVFGGKREIVIKRHRFMDGGDGANDGKKKGGA